MQPALISTVVGTFIAYVWQAHSSSGTSTSGIDWAEDGVLACVDCQCCGSINQTLLATKWRAAALDSGMLQ
jgi:hypothetical protein